MKKLSVLGLVVLLLLLNLLPMSARAAAPRALAEKRERFAEGVAQLDQKAFQQAVQTFRALMSDYRELPDYTQFFLAKAYLGATQYQDALGELQAFRASFPNHPLHDDALWLMANALVELKHEADALPLKPWIPTLKYNYVRIVPTSLSGRSFQRGEEPDRYGIQQY